MTVSANETDGDATTEMTETNGATNSYHDNVGDDEATDDNVKLTVKSDLEAKDGAVLKSGANGVSEVIDAADVDEGVADDLNDETEAAVTEEIVKGKAPDGGWGWFVVLGSFFVHVLMGGFERSNGVLYLQMMDKYGRSATATAWVLSIFSTLRLAMGPIASMLCNKFSCRFVTILGACICTIGVFASAFVPDLYYLYFTYGILGGTGRSFAYTPGLIIVGYYFNKRRGIAVGLATSGVGLGCFIFPPLFEVMFNYYGFFGSFLILTAVISNFTVCGALFRPLELHRQIVEQDRIRKARKEGAAHLLERNIVPKKQQANLLSSQSAAKMASSMELTANVKIEAHRQSLFRRKINEIKTVFKSSKPKKNERKKPLLELSLFSNFAFTALCIQLSLFTLSFNSTFVFLPALAKEKGVSQIYGAYLVSILGIFDMIARIVMSTVLDLKRVKPYRLIIYNLVMFATVGVSLMMPSVTTFPQFAIASALYGLLSGTYISQKSVVVVDVLGVEKLSSSFGLLLLFQGMSALIGPTIGGILYDLLGNYDMAFYFGSIGILLGGITMACANVWLYKKKKQKEREEKTAV